MKTKLLLLFTLSFNLIMSQSIESPASPNVNDQYIIVGWNDLGMHCANGDFTKLVVLPPYNNLTAQAIKKGDESNLPEVITTGFTVSYEVPGNTYSVGKTNFWDYEDQIFGINLADNIGLTGNGLSGNMVSDENSFGADGIPITPFTDNNLLSEDPYQLALLSLYDDQNNLLATTQPVIPVSNEINCVSSGCHSSETSILYQHENEGGFNPNNTPILCASCHSSNALGTTGMPGLESLSEVIHDQHKDKTNDCYKCHPGPNTQCQRGVMHEAGMVCQDCHGSLNQVAESIKNGREPWLEEPSCGSTSCHGSNYAEEPGKLFRQSKGHGGLFCSACHGSPHAILPSENERDNVQNIELQGFAGTLQRCELCHGVVPTAPGPHGILPPSAITQINLKAFLEGPFNGSEMNTFLNSGIQLPLFQPYNQSPWNYEGSENVTSIPNTDVVDWILVELRESDGPAVTATSDKIIARRAGFILKNGDIVDLDGTSPIEFNVPVYVNLYAVLRHRNHLDIMSSGPLTQQNDLYSFDFSSSADQVFGGIAGYKEISTGVFGMVGGDADADGLIQVEDLTNGWNQQAGTQGYQAADFDLNLQVNNSDKNNVWVPNTGSGSQIQSQASAYFSCMVPK